jgi:hypothetical protein
MGDCYVRVFKNREFHRWSKKQGITDETLLNAIREIEKGLYGANLGGGVFKKRVPFGGKGKSGGVRTILAFKTGKMAVFMYGFSKNQLDNISDQEEHALKALAKVYFAFKNDEIAKAINLGDLVEVHCEKINS